MPPKKGRFRNYTEESMRAAIDEVRLKNAPIRTAARKFGVPRATLRNKVEGISPIAPKMGPDSILKKDEERMISKWIINMASAGFPVSTSELLDNVQHLMKELKRDNPFNNDRPGRSWLKAFLQRNPEIQKRVFRNLASSRSPMTRANILEWFSEIRQYLKKNKLEEVLEDPSRIYNCDERAFYLDPEEKQVLAKKGDKSVYEQFDDCDENECLTVLLTGSAGGRIAPPVVLFQYKTIPQDIVNSFPGEWGLLKSDSGWMTCESFYDYVADIFHPWLEKTKVTLPIILFIGEDVTHLSLQTSQFCDEKGIILAALYPNNIHIRQPMDVAVFPTLKESWREKVYQWSMDHVECPVLKERDFSMLFKDVIEESISRSILANGFRKCGLYPWNPNALKSPREKDTNNIEEELDKTLKRIKYLEQGIQFLKDNLETEKLKAFRSTAESWNGNPHDLSLFLLYKKTETDIKRARLTLETLTAENTSKVSQESQEQPQREHQTTFSIEQENASVAGPSNVPNPFKRHFNCQRVSNRKETKKKKVILTPI